MAESDDNGIRVETKYHAPDGSCTYTIHIPYHVLNGDKSWYDDAFSKIAEQLKPFNLAPADTHWNSYQNAPTASWIIGGRAKPINETVIAHNPVVTSQMVQAGYDEYASHSIEHDEISIKRVLHQVFIAMTKARENK